MRKFTKSLMTLALLLAGVNSADAKVQIEGGIGNLVIPQTYENIGAWGGTWSGNSKENEKDWSDYEYVWVKYSGFSGSINFGVMYSEFKSHESWGDSFYDATASFVDPEGIVGIKLDNTTTYVLGNAETDGEYIGDVYAKHIREVFIQATAGGSNVTLEEMWVGSEAEFLADCGYNVSANHMLLVTNGDVKANVWDYQANYQLPTAMEGGKTYILTAAINAVNGGETRVVVSGGNGPQYLATKGLWENEFTNYQIEFEANGAQNKLEFDLGHVGGEIYIDNVSLVDKETGAELIANGDFEEPNSTAGWTCSNWSGTSIKQVEYALGIVQNPGILVSVGAAGWKTFRTGSNVSITDPNVHAYAAKYIAEGNYIELTEVTEFAAWQCVLIEAPQGNWMVRSPDDVTPIDDAINDLKANGPDALPADGTLYALAAKNDVVGFYRLSDEVPAWAIYMQIGTAEEAEGAPAFIGFNGGTTSISELNVKNDAEGVYYNLAGQRVAQPTKGLYIVNGKKYIVK